MMKIIAAISAWFNNRREAEHLLQYQRALIQELYKELGDDKTEQLLMRAFKASRRPSK